MLARIAESKRQNMSRATTGGLIGRVTRLGDTYLSVEIANGVEVQLQRSAVIQVLPKGSLK